MNSIGGWVSPTACPDILDNVRISNADKTKYMVMSRDQNAGRTHSIKTDNSFFERVEEFKYLGTTLTSDNSIQEEIKSRLKSAITRCRVCCLPVCYPKT
jgi:hypothetical protein